MALGLGIPLAWLASRTNLIGRHVLLGLMALALFVPLPMHALAWLGAFGNMGREQALGTGPILVGLPGAAFVHALASLPWVVLIVSVGLRSVEPELEDAARLDLPAWKVAWSVTLRRSIGAIAGSALAVAILTAGDMTVTDLIPLRTYAEESYTLAQLGIDQGRLAAISTLPQLSVILLLVLSGSRSLLLFDPARAASAGARARTWPLGWSRVPLSLVVWLLIGSLLVLPLYGLVWRAGRVGSGLIPGQGASWSLGGLWGTLRDAWSDLMEPGMPLERTYLVGTLLWCSIGASLTLAVAWPLAWKARNPGVWRLVAALLAALLLAAPGPIAGLGLKMAYAPVVILNRTPALMVLGYIFHTLPYVLLVLWPALRLIPQDLLDSAAVDGLNPSAIARKVAWPLSGSASLAAWCLSFALAIGELPTSYFLRAPGYDPLSVHIWGMLHVGVESRLAGTGLILLAVVGVVGSLAALSLGITVRRAETRALGRSG
jgi:iron(III) transport system permease protein